MTVGPTTLALVQPDPPAPGLAPPSLAWPPELLAWLQAYSLAPIPRPEWLAYAVAAEPTTPWRTCFAWTWALADVEGPAAPPAVFPAHYPCSGVLGEATPAERAWLLEGGPSPSPEAGRLVPAWLRHASGMQTAEPVVRGRHFAAVVHELGVSLARVQDVTGRRRGRTVHSWRT